MNITVYLGSTPGDDPAFMRDAQAVGVWIAERGHALVYGGSDVGCMGALARAARDGGAQVTGVEPGFFVEDLNVPQLPDVRLEVVPSMAERMTRMIELGDAFVALPGGPGTLEEISEIMSLVKLDRAPGPCAFYNATGFWDPLRAQLHAMRDHGFLPAWALERVRFVASVDELDAALS